METFIVKLQSGEEHHIRAEYFKWNAGNVELIVGSPLGGVTIAAAFSGVEWCANESNHSLADGDADR